MIPNTPSLFHNKDLTIQCFLFFDDSYFFTFRWHFLPFMFIFLILSHGLLPLVGHDCTHKKLRTVITTGTWTYKYYSVKFLKFGTASEMFLKWRWMFWPVMYAIIRLRSSTNSTFSVISCKHIGMLWFSMCTTIKLRSITNSFSVIPRWHVLRFPFNVNRWYHQIHD